MGRVSQPARVVLLLSVAATVGYLGYRFLAPGPAIPSAAVIDEVASAADHVLADSLPQFALDNLEGVPISIGNWPGRPLIINFWATWCAPCLREIPMLKEFQTEHVGIQIVGIAVDRLDPVRSFAAEMDFNYPILVGQTDAMEAVAAFGIQVVALPITVFTDPAGAVLGVRTGELHAEQLENYVSVLADLEGGNLDRAEARARLASTL
jgi:thiol-disulfide isomerase/thioredoxin